MSMRHMCPYPGEAHFWPELPATSVHIGCSLHESRQPTGMFFNCGIPSAFVVCIEERMVTLASGDVSTSGCTHWFMLVTENNKMVILKK